MDLTEKCLQKSRFYQTTGSAVFLQMLTFFQLTRAGDGVFQHIQAGDGVFQLTQTGDGVFPLTQVGKGVFQPTQAGDGVFPTYRGWGWRFSNLIRLVMAIFPTY